MVEPRLDEHPAYPWVQLLQRSQGRTLMAKHRAHSLGIGWSDPDGVNAEPALVFYIDDDTPAGEPIPPALVIVDHDGRTIAVPTRVVASPPASSE